MKTKFKRVLTFAVGALAFFCVLNSVKVQAKTDLLVYTAVEADELKKFKKLFEADNPYQRIY